MNRIEGWCIINRETGERWGGLYDTKLGAIKSFDKTSCYTPETHPQGQRVKFKEQELMVLQPLVLLDGGVCDSSN